ncbi:MAG: IS110 family transposase [Blastochloris sp.]|nr:IS110 family transposase [Blastochloris sp.]
MSTKQQTKSYQLYVGVDIAAKTFTIWWHDVPRVLTFTQSPDDFAAVCRQLAATGIRSDQILIVMEATGTYWIALAVALEAAGFCVSVINPAHIHNYVRSLPRRAKTDALDAQLIAQFAQERRPPTWTPPPAIYHELRQRLTARDALLEARKQLRNQQHALAQWPVQVESVHTHLERAIAELDTQIDEIETELAHLAANGAWAASFTLLESIPGVGLITAAWLVVLTLNFSGWASVATLVAYAGLAPFQRESGTSVQGRPAIGGGNARLRTALYMATLSAAQHNPQIHTFYKRLRDKGKPMKVARCAAARKLLELAFAVVTKRQGYDPTYGVIPNSGK